MIRLLNKALIIKSPVQVNFDSAVSSMLHKIFMGKTTGADNFKQIDVRRELNYYFRI